MEPVQQYGEGNNTKVSISKSFYLNLKYLKEEMKMKKDMKKLAAMFLAVIMIMINAAPAFAATTSMAKNAVAGYSIPASITLQVGEKKKLTVTQPAGKYAQVYFLLSSNIVTKSEFYGGAYWGKKAETTITGKTPGTCKATVLLYVHSKPRDPKSLYIIYKLNCQVNVVKKGTSTTQKPASRSIPLQKIALNYSLYTVNSGSTVRLSVSYTPSNTTDSRAVSWSSSNTNVATVSGGKVTTKKGGTATITARVGTKTATCKVTVNAVSSGKRSSTGSVQLSGASYKNVSDAYSILNNFRTNRANQWYWNSDNKTKTTTYGLKSLSRDPVLENVAKTRAKEQWTMYYERGAATHTRPNGTQWYTAYPANILYKGENLAWGLTTSKAVITDPTCGWAETNKKYSGQGHRRNMLNPNYTKVGIACYVKNGKTCWAMCLGR